MATQKKIYLYLARRDKMGMKILSVFSKNQTLLPTRVKDLKQLNLSQQLHMEISRTVQKERMLWEVWMESAPSYIELKKSLKKRGYRNLPHSSVPMHRANLPKVVKGVKSPLPQTETRKLIQHPTMLKKGNNKPK